MGRTLTESFKLQMKAVRHKRKKDAVEQHKPTFKNLGIGYKEKKKVIVNVYDVLHDDERGTSEVTETRSKGSDSVIKTIVCPKCGKQLEMNKHWEAYICECGDKKRIWVISNVENVVDDTIQSKE